MSCPRTGLKPMSMETLFSLDAGAKFVVYYAKDDDSERVRFDFETRTVESVSSGTMFDNEGDDWEDSPGSVPDRSDNLYDTSRGYAYFFHPKKP